MVSASMDNFSQRAASCRILSLSEDPQLGPLRATVLRHAGFDVTHPRGKTEIRDCVDTGGYDLLILGHSLGVEYARDLVSRFREKNPAAKVLAVAQTDLLPIRADRVIRAIDGPEVLIGAIHELVVERPDGSGKG